MLCLCFLFYLLKRLKILVDFHQLKEFLSMSVYLVLLTLSSCSENLSFLVTSCALIQETFSFSLESLRSTLNISQSVAFDNGSLLKVGS